MLIQPTLDALNRLKLHGMALALSEQMTNTAAQQLAFEERIALLLERESSHRENRRMGRLWTACQPKIRAAVIEDIDYRGRGGLDRAQLASLASCEWIRQSQSLLIHGATGAGKTYLACALAHQACRAGLSAWYVRAPRLFEELNLCHADGTFRKRLAASPRSNCWSSTILRFPRSGPASATICSNSWMTVSDRAPQSSPANCRSSIGTST